MGDDGCYYLLSGATNVGKFLESLKTIAKQDWGLYVEGVDDEDTCLVLNSAVKRNLPVLLGRDCVYPKRNTFIIVADRLTLARLQELSQQVISVDFVQSLVVFDSNRVIIEAYGLGFGPIILSTYLGEEDISIIQDATKGVLEKTSIKSD